MSDSGHASRQTAESAAEMAKDHTIQVDVDLDPVTIGRLCEQLRSVIERAGGGPVICDVNALRLPDVRAVDALARLQLTARRLGSSICLRDAPSELVDVLEFVGLLDTFPTLPADEKA